MKLNDRFPILVIEQNHLFHCVIKEMSILESGDDLTKTYHKAIERKIEHLNKIREADLEAILLPPSPPLPQKKAIGISLNALLFGCLLMVPLASVTLPAGRILTRVCKIFEHPIDLVIDFGKKLENLPPEKQDELKRSIRSLAAQFEEEPVQRS